MLFERIVSTRLVHDGNSQPAIHSNRQCLDSLRHYMFRRNKIDVVATLRLKLQHQDLTHSGEKSPDPCCSAFARKAAIASAARGNSGASGFTGPSSWIRRVMMPRAGLPVITFVTAV